ncbi:MAG: hypothetical protein JNK45_35620 [Myxococcales bacterium]|nr:hypothetical protein [Myxococcales bacterium]
MRRRLSPWALLLIGLAPVGLAACKETPSLRARWSLIDREGDSQPATAALQCTSLGINTVRIRVVDENGNVADDSYHACFARGFDDPEATVAGPALDAGRYAVEVRGVQRDLQPWAPNLTADDPLTSCNLDDVACDPRDIACDCVEFEARDDHTERLTDFVLTAPDECIDGIDNDRDGLLDANDPSCGLDVTPGREGKPVSKVQFQVLLSLFDDNPLATCTGLGLSDLRARVCVRAPGDDPAPCDAEATEVGLTCREREPTYFEQTLPEGSYTLEIVGRDRGDVVLTRPVLFPLTVAPGAGAFVPIDVDFPASAFEPPIEDESDFTLQYEDGSGATRGGCEPSGNEPGPTIETLSIEVLDAHGGKLPTPVTLSDGTPLDGTPIPCFQQEVTTERLIWGGYSIAIRARAADGTVCFATDTPLRLAPKSISLPVPRVLGSDGKPPASCE